MAIFSDLFAVVWILGRKHGGRHELADCMGTFRNGACASCCMSSTRHVRTRVFGLLVTLTEITVKLRDSLVVLGATELLSLLALVVVCYSHPWWVLGNFDLCCLL